MRDRSIGQLAKTTLSLAFKTPAMLLVLALTACGSSGESDSNTTPLELNTQALLGEALFQDTNLSLNRSQSCATCHNPDRAFTDSNEGADGKTVAVSTGDDGVSLGDRNAPTVTYASLIPEFQQGTRERFNSQQSDYNGWMGGQFHDGRATDLAAQAGGPPLNPIEMGMPSKASVVERLLENVDYVESFEYLFGEAIFNDSEAAYAAMTEAIAAFEQQESFAPFDSKYDRSLLDDDDPNFYRYQLFSKADEGKGLFFSPQFTNCSTCHMLTPQNNKAETFSGYEYHNIGVPENESARAANGAEEGFVDTGLQINNNSVTAATERGKFKTPTLRNVAVTAPYMHNGVFQQLDTVIKFYDQHLDSSQFTENPETGLPWADPEISANLALQELRDASAMDQSDVDALVCFLLTLTDARYEQLISDEQWDECEQPDL